MASVHRRPQSRFWHAGWRDADGRWCLRSTKQTDRKKALVMALEFERAAQMAARGDLVEEQARKVVSGIMERVGEGSIQVESTVAYLRGWVKSKRAVKSAGTAERYRFVIESFLGNLGRRANRPVTSITGRHIESFLNSRLRSGCSTTTVNLDGKILRTAFNAARRRGLILTNPAEAVDLPEKDSVERGTFTPEEVHMLVQAAQGEWKTLILVGYYTGARLSDCCRLEWQNVDLVKGTLSYRPQKTRSKVKQVLVPLHPELANHLEDLATADKPQKFIMPHMSAMGPGGRHGLSEGFKRIVRKAGLDLQTVEGTGRRNISRRTFHALRHSFTSALANAGVAPEIRMKLTGHKSAEVHRGYTHHELEVLRQQVEKIPNLPQSE